MAGPRLGRRQVPARRKRPSKHDPEPRGQESPPRLITDCLPACLLAYMKSQKSIRCKDQPRKTHLPQRRQEHLCQCRPCRDPTFNSKMKRLNGMIRDREETFRGLGSMDTPAFDGMRCTTATSESTTPSARHLQGPRTSTPGTLTSGRPYASSSLYLIAADQRAWLFFEGGHEFTTEPRSTSFYIWQMPNQHTWQVTREPTATSGRLE